MQKRAERAQPCRTSWEIMVPIRDNKGEKYSFRWHKEWDAKIVSISNGLTIQKKVKGKWISIDGKLHEEHMIQVIVDCTPEEIKKIEDITAGHYKQKAICSRKISDEAHLVVYDDNFKRVREWPSEVC